MARYNDPKTGKTVEAPNRKKAVFVEPKPKPAPKPKAKKPADDSK